MSRYVYGARGPRYNYQYGGVASDSRGRKRNPNFQWKKSPQHTRSQKQGSYDHENIEKEILKSNQLNKEENKLNDDDDDNSTTMYADNAIQIRKGVYYHHDRKTNKNGSIKNEDSRNNKISNNNAETNSMYNKENYNKYNNNLVKTNKESRKLKLTRIYNNQNGRHMYSNEFERNIIQKNTRKRKQFPLPYPPNHRMNTKNTSNLYQQPYIDSPKLQANRRQQRMQQQQQQGSPYYGNNYNQYGNNNNGSNVYPSSQAHALMQLRYEAQSAAANAQALYDREYQTQNKYGQYLSDGSWYPYPESQVRFTDKTINKSVKTRPTNVNRNDKVKRKIRFDFPEMNIPEGQKVNRVQNQLEYYFSEQNLTNDAHLRSLLDNQGWAVAKDIENFPRMLRYGAKKDIIVEAAYHSNFIEVKDNKYIRMKMNWERYVKPMKSVANNNMKSDPRKVKSDVNIDVKMEVNKDDKKTKKIKNNNKVIDIDLKSINPDEINDEHSLSRKEIKNIVKSIQLKDKKRKERKKKQKESKKKQEELQTALTEMNQETKKKDTSDDDQDLVDID